MRIQGYLVKGLENNQEIPRIHLEPIRLVSNIPPQPFQDELLIADTKWIPQTHDEAILCLKIADQPMNNENVKPKIDETQK